MSNLIFFGVGCHGEWWGGFHSSHALVHVQFMRVFCSARKGRAWGGGGGARAGGKESSVSIDIQVFFWNIRGKCFESRRILLTTVPSASPVEGSRRSGAIRMQNALKNASVVAGEGVSRTGVSLLGMPVYIRGKTLRRRRRRRRRRF